MFHIELRKIKTCILCFEAIVCLCAYVCTVCVCERERREFLCTNICVDVFLQLVQYINSVSNLLGRPVHSLLMQIFNQPNMWQQLNA